MKQSPELTEFYRAYHGWLESGAPEENKYNFERFHGLCFNLYIFLIDESGYRLPVRRMTILDKEMIKQFAIAGLDKKYPFGEKAYCDRAAKNKQHLDPNRIKWVKAHLTEEVDEKFELV